MPDPTDAEIETGAEALDGPLIGHGAVQQGYRRTVADAVLRAVLPDHDARTRAEERARVAEEIAAHFEERGDRSTGIPPFRAAQIARQHATTTEGDRHV